MKDAVTDCIDELNHWMASNRLKLNPSKTEFLWATIKMRQHVIESTITISGADINPSENLKLLGALTDSSLSFESQVSNIMSGCFYRLRQLRTILRILTLHAAKTLVNCFVMSRLDHCNSPLEGQPTSSLDRLQRVFNAAAKIIHLATKYLHTTSLWRVKTTLVETSHSTSGTSTAIDRLLHGMALACINELYIPATANERSLTLWTPNYFFAKL